MPRVKIFSTATCTVCKRAKQDFDREGVSYEEIHVDEDAQAFQDMMNASGNASVPQFEIDGVVRVGYGGDVLALATDDFLLDGVGGQEYATCESCEG